MSAAPYRFGRRSGRCSPEPKHASFPAKASSPLRPATALHTTRQLPSELPLECGGKRSATPLWAPKQPLLTRTGARVLPSESVVAASPRHGAPHRAATLVRALHGVRWQAQRDTALGSEPAVEPPNQSTRPSRRKRRRRSALPTHSTPRGNIRVASSVRSFAASRLRVFPLARSPACRLPVSHATTRSGKTPPPQINCSFVVVASASQLRGGLLLIEPTSLIEIWRPSVLAPLTSTSLGWQVCWLIFWCGAGLYLM